MKLVRKQTAVLSTRIPVSHATRKLGGLARRGCFLLLQMLSSFVGELAAAAIGDGNKVWYAAERGSAVWWGHGRAPHLWFRRPEFELRWCCLSAAAGKGHVRRMI
jgi:hypothetical protein